MKQTMLLVGAGLLMLTATPAFAVGVDLTAQIGAASTAAEHDALADTYTKEAAEAEADAVRHDKMAASYKGLGKIGQYHNDQHCEAMAARDREQAKELTALAAAHRAQAKAGK